MEIDKKEYGEYVKKVTPVHSTARNILRAFVTGGAICLIGQALTELFLFLVVEKEAASAWTTLSLIGGSVLLTGLNLYPRLVKFGGAGALVPITGFANSVVAPAIEYRAEGHVFGIGCKIFTIAGPVILFGIFSSWLLGLISWAGGAMGFSHVRIWCMWMSGGSAASPSCYRKRLRIIMSVPCSLLMSRNLYGLRF